VLRKERANSAAASVASLRPKRVRAVAQRKGTERPAARAAKRRGTQTDSPRVAEEATYQRERREKKYFNKRGVRGGRREEGGDGEEAGLEAPGGERVNPGEPSLALLCGQFGPVSHLGHHGSVYDGAGPRGRAGRRPGEAGGGRRGG